MHIHTHIQTFRAEMWTKSSTKYTHAFTQYIDTGIYVYRNIHIRTFTGLGCGQYPQERNTHACTQYIDTGTCIYTLAHFQGLDVDDTFRKMIHMQIHNVQIPGYMHIYTHVLIFRAWMWTTPSGKWYTPSRHPRNLYAYRQRKNFSNDAIIFFNEKHSCIVPEKKTISLSVLVNVCVWRRALL
jgi:hypothetical protein